MSTAISAEQEDNLRLRKAEEFIVHCRQAENTARQELARAIEQSKRAKEKHDELFMECEKRAVARRKAGQIEVVARY